MELTDSERGLLLAALFELRITAAWEGEDRAQGEEIDALVRKLGGDPEAVFFGAYDIQRTDGRDVPLPDYPGDDTDEG